MIVFNNLIIGLIVGMIFPIQATLGARLNSGSDNKYIGTFIAFSLGSVILLFINIAMNSGSLFSFNTYSHVPMLYLIGGGIVGVVYNALTMNLFSRIGAYYTTVFTLVGQILTGIIIDTFGLFEVPVRPLTVLSVIGVALAVFGAIYANKNKDKGSQSVKIWIVVGTVLIGALPPLQQVFNKVLSTEIGSPILATFISFLVGTLALLAMFAFTRKKISIPRLDSSGTKIPMYSYLGGLGGIMILMGNIIILPILGSTLSIIVSQIGQFTMSMILDHYGLLGIKKQPMQINKLTAVLLMILGSFLIKM